MRKASPHELPPSPPDVLARSAELTRAAGPAPRVKVCGITNLEDAELAVGLGAWALGMIFFEGSPRRCSPAQAQLIGTRLRRRVGLCGVFVNATLDTVVGASEELGLTLLQFHGDEGPSFCAEAARRTGARVIKAAQVSGPGDVRDLERFRVDFHLLDARPRRSTPSAPGGPGLRGGTGETFDWKLVAGRHSTIPLILSGGLHAGNVAEAIGLTSPFAVDTASGTEAAPGHKDPEKLRAFFASVAGSRSGQGPELSGVGATVETGAADPAIATRLSGPRA
jgi:phosphoribosylanthranilate isomerase